MGTELLSYALLIFLVFVYLPYAFFTLFAERFIDLGHRRDATQLEEIISAFMPALVFHVIPVVIFLVARFGFGFSIPFDLAAVASIFGKDRGAISDYIYGGNLYHLFAYISLLWANAALLGLWFGAAARWMCRHDAALDGIDQLSPKRLHAPWWVYAGWWPWAFFFHESFVPLYTLEAQREPFVRVEANDHRLYYAIFMGYEKTSDGRLDAIRLSRVKCYFRNKADTYRPDRSQETPPVDHVYVKWAHVLDIHVIKKTDYDAIDATVAAERQTLLHAKRIATPPAPTVQP